MTRIIVVTGASSGIGRAAAVELAGLGDTVTLVSRSRTALESAAAACRAHGTGTVDVAVADVRDAAAIEQVIAGTVAAHGRLDAVIHSAGVAAYGRFEDIPAAVFDAVVETNVHGAANVARATLPVLRRQRHGSLVLIGSVVGNIAVPFMTPYVISKYALRALGRQLAIENRDLPDVHVTVVSPGSVDTPIYRQSANFEGRAGRPPAPVDSAAKVAHAAIAVLDRPRDRVSVGLANPLMRLGFSAMPAVFDAVVVPMFRLAALRPGRQEPTAGNVIEAQAEIEAVSGGETQGVRDMVFRLLGR